MDDEAVWTQKRRVAAAMRRVIEHCLTAIAPADEWRLVADRLEQYVAHLEQLPKEHVTWGNPETATAGAVRGFFDLSPFIGQANPLAAPMSLWTSDNVAHGRVTFGWAYQGPPGHVHGGFIAATFDEVLGFAQSMTGRPGMTGTLTIRFRAPTPLYTELRLEATVQKTEGRKIFCEGRMYAGDTLTAEAEGIFISFRPDLLEKLEAGRRRIVRDP
jgi:acyl-coenzyme A thioesterase PaaI-like protein